MLRRPIKKLLNELQKMNCGVKPIRKAPNKTERLKVVAHKDSIMIHEVLRIEDVNDRDRWNKIVGGSD